MKKLFLALFFVLQICQSLASNLPEVIGPISGGLRQAPWLSAVEEYTPLEKFNYLEEEYFFKGRAKSRNNQGHLTGREAEYQLRLLVRRPKNKDQFSQTVVVEWFNVSAQMEMPVVWAHIYDEILNQGHAYIGISMQKVGVEASPLAIKYWDPIRYKNLNHPGDEYVDEIFGQVARLLKSEKAEKILGQLKVKFVIGSGESQSAALLSSYINQVHSDHQIFDGYLVDTWPSVIRKDIDVPVMMILSESEVDGFTAPHGPFGTGKIFSILGKIENLNFLKKSPPRYPGQDHQNLRVWEVAGTTHVDNFVFKHALEGLIQDMSNPMAIASLLYNPAVCIRPINRLELGRAMNAALRQLDRWVRFGEAPPSYPRIVVNKDKNIIRGEEGLALGGIRLPPMDAPIGVNRGDSCLLFGSYNKFSKRELTKKYGSFSRYFQLLEESVANSINAGTLLPEHGKRYLDEAQNVKW